MAVDRGNLSGHRCDWNASGNIGQGDLRWQVKTPAVRWVDERQMTHLGKFAFIQVARSMSDFLFFVCLAGIRRALGGEPFAKSPGRSRRERVICP